MTVFVVLSIIYYVIIALALGGIYHRLDDIDKRSTRGIHQSNINQKHLEDMAEWKAENDKHIERFYQAQETFDKDLKCLAERFNGHLKASAKKKKTEKPTNVGS